MLIRFALYQRSSSSLEIVARAEARYYGYSNAGSRPDGFYQRYVELWNAHDTVGLQANWIESAHPLVELNLSHTDQSFSLCGVKLQQHFGWWARLSTVKMRRFGLLKITLVHFGANRLQIIILGHSSNAGCIAKRRRGGSCQKVYCQKEYCQNLTGWVRFWHPDCAAGLQTGYARRRRDVVGLEDRKAWEPRGAINTSGAL